MITNSDVTLPQVLSRVVENAPNLFPDGASAGDDFEIKVPSNGIYWIPILPTQLDMTDINGLYNEGFSLFSFACYDKRTVLMPEEPQIRPTGSTDFKRSRALFYPTIKGTYHQLSLTFDALKSYSNGNFIAMMARGSKGDQKFQLSGFDCLHSIGIQGKSRSGKTYLDLTIARLLLAKGYHVIACDIKNSTLARFGRHHNLKVIAPDINNGTFAIDSFVERLNELMQKLINNVIQKRQAEMMKNSISDDTDFRCLGAKPYYLFIDELGLIALASRRLRQKFNKLLTIIVVAGAESGLYCVLSAQRLDAKVVNTLIVQNLGVKISLGDLNYNETRALYPSVKKTPFMPSSFRKGSGIISVADAQHHNIITPFYSPTITQGGNIRVL